MNGCHIPCLGAELHHSLHLLHLLCPAVGPTHEAKQKQSIRPNAYMTDAWKEQAFLASRKQGVFHDKNMPSNNGG